MKAHTLTTRTFGALAALALVPCALDAQVVALGGSNDEEKPSLAPLLREVTPAVVNISVLSRRPVEQNPLLQDPFFRRFFDLPDEAPESVPIQSAGSGVIIDADQGLVVTNHHVIANAEQVMVTLTDRRRFEAELVGSDPGTDIALLRIMGEALHEVPLGDSEALEVGDFVVAIGNPFGLGQTVTSGIVSALGRSGLNVEGYEDFIQTDASINPGNSGGALIDLSGTLVGINTAILTPAGGNVGIGFAIPAEMARQVIGQLLEHGEVRRGRLGVQIQTLTPDLAEALQLDVNEGAVVMQVEPGSAAARAGIEPGNVVVEFNGEPVMGAGDLKNKVGLSPVGTTVALSVLANGERRRVEVPIVESGASTAADGQQTIEQLAGVEFGEIPPNHPLYGSARGVLVTSVMPGSNAMRSGLMEGDVIVAVNRTPVRSVAELSAVLAMTSPPIALNVRRADGQLFIVIR